MKSVKENQYIYQKCQHRSSSDIEMVLIFGSQLASRRSARAAVVPYTIRPTANGGWQLWFLLGIHADSGDVTDFGGGVKKHEYDITGGHRELDEETKAIFKNAISLNDLNTCVAAVMEDPRRRNNRRDGDGGMSVIFVPIGNDWFEKAPVLFDNASKKGNSHNEISRLVWLCEDDFLRLVRSPDEVPDYTMWSRLRKFYSSVYTNELHDLLYIRFWWFTPNFQVERSRVVEQCVRRMVVTTTVQYKLSPMTAS